MHDPLDGHTKSGGGVRIRYIYPAFIGILSTCGPRPLVDPQPELRPSLQSVTIAREPEQRYEDGVPIGPPSGPLARLERRTDTLIVRGSIPHRVKWPPTVKLEQAGRMLDLSLNWRFFEAGSFIQIRGDRPRPWEAALAPVAPGQWRIRVTQRDSINTVLSSWTVDTTLNQ